MSFNNWLFWHWAFAWPTYFLIMQLALRQHCFLGKVGWCPWTKKTLKKSQIFAVQIDSFCLPKIRILSPVFKSRRILFQVWIDRNQTAQTSQIVSTKGFSSLSEPSPEVVFEAAFSGGRHQPGVGILLETFDSIVAPDRLKQARWSGWGNWARGWWSCCLGSQPWQWRGQRGYRRCTPGKGISRNDFFSYFIPTCACSSAGTMRFRCSAGTSVNRAGLSLIL